jgi:hypothetical protein
VGLEGHLEDHLARFRPRRGLLHVPKPADQHVHDVQRNAVRVRARRQQGLPAGQHVGHQHGAPHRRLTHHHQALAAPQRLPARALARQEGQAKGRRHSRRGTRQGHLPLAHPLQPGREQKEPHLTHGNRMTYCTINLDTLCARFYLFLSILTH